MTEPPKPCSANDAAVPTTGRGAPTDADFRALVESVEDYAIFMLDQQGRVLSWNKGAAKIKGYTAEEIRGRHFSCFYTEEALKRGWPDYELRQAASLGRFEDEGWRVRKDGTTFWASVIITAIRDPDGRLTGFAKITRDQTERRILAEALRQSEERFRLLVESVTDCAIFMLDPTGHIVSWNAGAENIKGYRRAEIIGKHFSVFYSAQEVAAGKPARELALATRFGHLEDEGWRVRKDGSAFWASVTITAVYDEEKHLCGFAKVTRDMTGQRQREELEQSGERMKQFLATLGHELRNPLAAVHHNLSVMQLNPLTREHSRRSCEVIERQVKLLTRLVDDLLDIGRITSGKISLRTALIDLREVMTRGIEAGQQFTGQRAQSVDVHLPPEPVIMRGDMTRLVQVIQNLLHNASKFSPEGSRIEVSATGSAEGALIEIRDSGCGIPAGSHRSVFELFSQAPPGDGLYNDGLGIGLALCKSLVELHGGSIFATSAGVGKGTTFSIQLPVVADAHVADAHVANAQAQVPANQQAQSGQHGSATPLRILIVDDNRDAADGLGALLELKGHEVQVFYDGRETLQAAGLLPPHVALIDIAMPAIDGYAVLNVLRDAPGFERTVFGAMTGFGQPGDRERTREAGFNAHLVKPVDWSALEELLHQADLRRVL